jgi:hypothetical protein
MRKITAVDVDQIFEGLKGNLWYNVDDALEDLGIEDELASYEACDNVFFYCAGCCNWCETAERADEDNVPENMRDEWVCDSCFGPQ